MRLKLSPYTWSTPVSKDTMVGSPSTIPPRIMSQYRARSKHELVWLKNKEISKNSEDLPGL